MPYRLVSAEGEQAYEVREGATLVVGRAVTSDVPVIDPTISRRHAEVTCDASGVTVRDVGSSNGTFINGTKIETATRVASGDMVTFGKVAFRLMEITPTAPAHAPGPPAAKPGATVIRHIPPGMSPQDLVAALRRSEDELAAVPNADAPTQTGRDRNEQKLALLLNISMQLTKAGSVETLLEQIVKYCFDIFDVDRVSILLADENGLAPKLARDKKGKELGEMVPQSIARYAVEDKVGLITDNASEDSRFGGQSILMQQVRSAMCAPLVGSENTALGVIYVDSQMTNHRMSPEDLELLIAFSGIAAVAIENGQFAQRIQKETIIRSNFERFFTPGLAARIAESPDAVKLGGDKRPVAVLFSDIRGFTAMSETMFPDQMARLLTEYFTEMVECVFRNGGTLDKFIGDAVMAQWGAPIGGADDPDRAMRAAIEMMRELAMLNARWRAEGRPELKIGIGLNYGEAFAGNIGSERRLEYTVIGDTVNTASRLCSAAAGGEILITEEMKRMLRSAPELVERPPMELKGKSQPVPVYSVTL